MRLKECNRRLLTGLLAIVIVVALALSSCFILKEATHSCHEESCPVCMVMQQCAENIRGLGTALVIAAVAAVIYQITMVSGIDTIFYGVNTPVSLNVRMNN